MKPFLPRAAACACLFSLLSACMVGPNYVRPPVAEPPSYRPAPLDGQAMAGDPDVAWWNDMGDPVLVGLVESAMRNNYDARIAAARIEQFRGQLQIARSGLFPQVGASFGATREKSSRFGGTALAALDGPGNTYQGLASVSWEIDLWGRTRRLSEAALANLWGAEYARRAEVLSLAAAVVQGYVTLRALDAQLDIARLTLKARADAMELFRLRYQGGVVSEMQYAQAQTAYWETQSVIPPLLQSRAQTENALSVLTGLPPGPVVAGKPIAELKAPLFQADLPVNLLSRRPDLLQAEQAAIAANALVGANEALYLPALDLTGFIGQASGSFGNLWKSASKVWSLGAGLTQPVFEGGAISGQVAQARSQSKQAALAYQAAVLDALVDVDNALQADRQSRERGVMIGHEVDSLRVYLEQASARFEGGYSSYLEVTDAQEKLFSAQLNQVQAKSDTLIGLTALYKALGGGWNSVPADVIAAGETGTAPAPRSDSSPSKTAQ
jgi:multidrug efflux system outer membrane protein